MRSSPTTRSASSRLVAAKVPEVTVAFWIVKVLTTGMGEAASDYLGELSLVLAGVIGVGGVVAALRWQLRADRYRAPVYWTAVAMVAVFGTMAADLLHVVLGISYVVSTPVCAVALAVVLLWWYRSEGTLSIHSITTPRRERFYWATVLATFALGTAAGDLTAGSMHLGYLDSGLLFTAAIAVPFVGWRWLGLGEIPAFWTAYVLTRPLGASFADWFGKDHRLTGLGYGDGVVAGIELVVIIALVAWLTVSGHGVQRPRRDFGHLRPSYVGGDAEVA
ncbi:MAG: COG4705 family protein [Marmoricola sp.]